MSFCIVVCVYCSWKRTSYIDAYEAIIVCMQAGYLEKSLKAVRCWLMMHAVCEGDMKTAVVLPFNCDAHRDLY